MTDTTNVALSKSLDAKTIGFIGAGNMAQAIIKGLLSSGLNEKNIIASVKSEKSKLALEQTLSITLAQNAVVAAQSDILILCVKPQVLKQVCAEISTHIEPSTLVISVAAGIACASIETWLDHSAIIRAMPNTPASIGHGVSGLYATNHVSSEQKHTAKSILEAVGIAEFVEHEALIDTVTAISGSAPAYFFLFLEAMIESAVNMGLDEQTAKKFAVHTAIGAGNLASVSDIPIENLRKMVTSPNGTTEKALLALEDGNIRSIIDQAMHACVKRAQELSKELSSHS